MSFSSDPDIGANPAEGDWIRVSADHFQVIERCPCGPETSHVRWFLQGEDRMGPLSLPVEAMLTKEWNRKNEVAWWFGRRVALTDLRTRHRRLTETLRRAVRRLPSQLYYDGRPFKLITKSRPPKKLDPGVVPVTVWEYIDKDDTQSLLIELAADGGALAYHGWYADPDDLSVAH